MRAQFLRFFEAGVNRLRQGIEFDDQLRRAGPATTEGDIGRQAERGVQLLGRGHAVIARTVVVIVSGLLTLPGVSEGGLRAISMIGLAVMGCGAYWLSLTSGRRRWLVVDLAIVGALCLSQAWTVSPDMLNGGTGWVRTLASIAVVAYQWHARPVVGAAAAVTISITYLVGFGLSSEVTWGAAWAGALWLLGEAAQSRGLLILVRRAARKADELWHREEVARRRRAVAAATRADEREYLAALHDTAAATLLMVGLGVLDGRQRWLSEQAGRDVKILTGRVGVDTDDVELVEMLRSTARRSPLDITWTDDGPFRVPRGPAEAICRCLHETLTNVVRHAGVEAASVRVERHGDAVLVEVTDLGRGFTPEAVSPHRRGVSLSILERMGGIGGTASVTSRPGRGTRVRLTWSPSAREREIPAEAAERIRRARSTEVTAGGFLRGLRLAIFGINVVLLLTWEPAMLFANASLYRSFSVQVASYGVCVLVVAVSGVRVLRDRPMGGWGRPLMAIVLVATLAATVAVPPEYMGTPAHWTYGNVGWAGLLLLMDSPLRVLVAVLFVDYAAALALLVATGSAGFGPVAVLTMASVIIWAYQLGVAGSTLALRRIAEMATRTSLEAERSRTREAVSQQIHRDRQARYAVLAATAVPLLEGLASGELDPADQRVRRACATEAARMRRLFAESDDTPDPLVHELQACMEDAERRGVTVSFAVRGSRPVLSRDVRRALTEPVLGGLMAAATRARVTLVASSTAATVSVVADTADTASTAGTAEEVEVPFAGSQTDQVTVTHMTTGGQLRVEATWREKNRSRWQ